MRRAFTLRFEELLQTDVVRILPCGVVPLRQQLVSLGFAQDRDVIQFLVRSGQQRFEQHLEVIRHALDGLALEQVGVVLEGHERLVVLGIANRHRQVELCSLAVNELAPELDTGQLGAGHGEPCGE